LLWLLPQHCHAQEVQVSAYPECVQPGDSYYVKVTFVNDSEENYYCYAPPLFFGIPETKRFALSRNGNIYEWLPEVVRYAHPDAKFNEKYSFPPKSQSILLLLAFQFPSLEDLHSEFWKNEMEALKNNPEGLDYELEILISKLNRETPQKKSNSHENNDVLCKLSSEEVVERLRDASRNSLEHLKTNVRIKLRSADEMALIEQWYQSTPESLWPKIAKYTAPLPGCKETGFLQYFGRHSEPKNWIKADGAQFTFGERKLTPWDFVRLGNRYPSDPNAPETWQGWKELEERITPSTMRDEIRLTRIFIQYCDTKDESVLEELREWFVEMNEVQRTCMTNMILGRSRSSILQASFRDLYHAIREYDTAVKRDNETTWLKQQELLE
jgi:hypothetical protein